MMSVAYVPHSALPRIKNGWHINIPRLKWDGNDAGEDRNEEGRGEGHDGRELHDEFVMNRKKKQKLVRA